MATKKMITGSEILLECLKRENVEVMFGYPGGVLIGFYDKLLSDKRLTHILPRHEQGGIHAAEGYARASGRVGVCMGTSGPGATNLVTGIADAYADSTPLVVLTGQVVQNLIGNDAFQEVDIIGITRPIVKHSYLVTDVEDIARIVREAFHIARSGRPGPVLIDLPKDVLAAEYEFKTFEKLKLRGYNPVMEGDTYQIKKLIKALETAERPLIFCGGGVISGFATSHVEELVEMTNIPVVTSFMGQGAFPKNHKNYVGWSGMHGNYSSNVALNNSDLIVAIGTRFSDRTTGNIKNFVKKAKIAHIDIDPASISKNIKIDIPIVGNTKVVLKQVLELMKIIKPKWEIKSSERGAWLTRIKAWNDKHPFTYDLDSKEIKPQYIMEELSRQTKGEAIICTDVGQHQMWAAQFYDTIHPRTFISSGGLGTMGFSLPASMGAQLAFPYKTVVSISGDGGFLMNMQELVTISEHNLPIKIFIINNKSLGMVRQWQTMFFGGRYSFTDLSYQPDFIKIAEGCGIEGISIDKPEDVDKTIAYALSVNDRPILVNFMISPDECVLPIVPPGKGNIELLLKSKTEKKSDSVVPNKSKLKI